MIVRVESLLTNQIIKLIALIALAPSDLIVFSIK
jgi:hypothetical protein